MQYFNIYFRFTVLLILYYKSILSNINIYEATVPDSSVRICLSVICIRAQISGIFGYLDRIFVDGSNGGDQGYP